MSDRSKTEIIQDETDYVVRNFELAACYRVERSTEVSTVQYCTQYMLLVTEDGYDEPGADVLIRLLPKSKAGLHPCDLYLWDRQIWSSTSNGPDNTSRWMMLLTLVGDIGA